MNLDRIPDDYMELLYQSLEGQRQMRGHTEWRAALGAAVGGALQDLVDADSAVKVKVAAKRLRDRINKLKEQDPAATKDWRAGVRASRNTYRPPPAVAAAARKALDLRASLPASRRAMTPVGLARANQLANRRPVSASVLRRMSLYFARHAVDAKGRGWGKDSKGYQAWLGWGGDPGRAWAQAMLAKSQPGKEKRAAMQIAQSMEIVSALLYDQAAQRFRGGRRMFSELEKRAAEIRKKDPNKRLWTVREVAREIMAAPVSLDYWKGEVKELADAIFKDRSLKSAYDEYGDVTLMGQLMLHDKGVPLVGRLPVTRFNGANSLKKFIDRRAVWEDIFAHHGVPFHKRYLKGGGNYAKLHKVEAALAAAGFNGKVDVPWLRRQKLITETPKG